MGLEALRQIYGSEREYLARRHPLALRLGWVLGLQGRWRPEVTRGTGSVFADLGFPDAAERQARLRLAYGLNQELEARKISQADAAKVLGVTQPKVSALRRYKLEGFSVERLMNLLTALDQDVEIVIRRKPRSRKAGRISVVAA